MENREIKFRAWDKKANEMISWDGMYGLERTNESDTAVHVAIADHVYLMPENMHLMQYTGLKDKNGVEIYEGDIISAKPKGANYPTNWVVVFNDDAAFRVRWYGRYVKNESSFYDEKINVSKHEIYEVIGNIHENPELLK